MVTEENICKLLNIKCVEGVSGGVKLHFPVITDELQKEIEEMVPYIVKNLNTTFLLRLYASRLLPSTVHQVLYMDVDTIVSGSLKELANLTLGEDIALAAVKDLVRYDDYPRLGLDSSKHVYFNSGIMLLNLDYWRKHNTGDKCLQLLVKYSSLYNMPDQDALNVVCEGHVTYLHPRYNCLVFFFARREYLKARVREEEFNRVLEAIESPAIIHYVFVNKPWYKGGYLPKRELWLSALSKTPWKDMPIGYRGGMKGKLRYCLKSTVECILPLFGLHARSEIFYKRRALHIECLSLLLYYGFAYWLPNFDARLFGKVSNSIRLFCVRNLFDYVGKGVHIGRKARFGNGRKIWIGSRSNIGANCFVPNNIIIGNDVMMGPDNFFFAGFTHRIDDVNKPMIEQGFKFIDGVTEIGDDVWIGRDCLFMPCLKIGSHSVVGARSVVTKDVPQHVIVAGNPAKVVKERK